MAGQKKKNSKDQQWIDKRAIKNKVKKPTIKQKTLEFDGHLVPLVVDHKRGSVYSCLLYTSPSPRDQRGSRMPSSA